MKISQDIINNINDIRKYFTGLDLDLNQVIQIYIRGNFHDNISLSEPENIYDVREEMKKREKTLVKRKYF